MSIAWVVFRKELRETLRDRRTLMVMVAIPILLYPVLLIATEQFALMGIRRIESEASEVAVTGPASDDLMEFLAADQDLELLDVPYPVEAIRSEIVGAVAVFGPVAEEGGTQRATVLYDAADERSQRAGTGLARARRGRGATVRARGRPGAGRPEDPAAFRRPLRTAAGGTPRVTGSGGILGPEQALSYEEWLRLYTAGAAYAGGQEHESVPLTPGQRPEFVVLSSACPHLLQEKTPRLPSRNRVPPPYEISVPTFATHIVMLRPTRQDGLSPTPYYIINLKWNISAATA